MKKIYFFLAAMCCAAMMSATEGALSGKFTIDSEGNKVAFSQGNLQYFAPYGRWQFAENQWDYIGGSNDPYATVDLFSWGTGGEDPVIFYTSTDNNDFLSDREWGSASISNGGNEDNLWRTLTMDEWDYLFCGRPNASTRFGFGTVNNVKGLIILPDVWTLPVGSTFSPSTAKGLEKQGSYYQNTAENNFSHNTYSDEEWAAMEEAGAVFLPAGGARGGSDVYSAGEEGSYWSMTGNSGSYAYALNFTKKELDPQASYSCFYGRSVRLVQNVTEPVITTNQYYVAGNGVGGNPWCDETNWMANGSPMKNGVITFHDVPAGVYEFKITDGVWGMGHEASYGSVDLNCCSPNVLNGGTDASGNIKLITSITQDITITYDGHKICVTGIFDDPSSVTIHTYTVVGDYNLLGSGWDVDDDNNNMTYTAEGVYTLTKSSVSLVASSTYQYKVVGNHSYSVFELPASGNNNMLTVTETGYYDVVFTLDLNANTLTHTTTKVTPLITTVSATFEAPEVFQPTNKGNGAIYPSNSLFNVVGKVSIPDGVNYEISKYTFYISPWAAMDDETFQSGKQYCIAVTLRPKDGYTFPHNGVFVDASQVDMLINGAGPINVGTNDVELSLYAYFIPQEVPTAIEEPNDGTKAVKIIRDNQLYIIRDGKTYNAIGIEIERR
ncbi:MAG: hypothetical protein II928_02500 [Paludibacteraceae bacterium]|nr:hypothetical protein [Paludibacteraceae bacterium]